MRLIEFLTPVCAAVVITATGAAQNRTTTLAGRSTVYAPSGAIATSQPLATTAGLAVLQNGGNAIDAAVTAAAVLNLVEPHMTGIGGDLFAIVWLADERRLIGLNASGRSGSLMTRETLRSRGHDDVPLFGAEPITIPGALSGWAALLARHGTMALADALQPAIALADGGFPVTPIIAAQWAAEEERLRADPGAAATFLVNGRPPAAGTWFRNPDLARTFRMIATEGPGVLYGGALGQSIVAHVRSLGGYLTPEDLRAHAPTWVEPMSVAYGDHRLWELPPNGQGVAALEMLRLIETADLRALGHNTAAYLHLLIEAKKIAFADVERFVGDPDAMTVPAESLLTDGFITARRAMFDPRRAAERAEPGVAATSSETIYLAAADREGNMVSFINSIYWEFGSGVVAPGTGFALQNRGAGFTLEPDRANTVGPNKLPFHTLIPAFVTRDGSNGPEPLLSFGVMGGSMQPQGHVQVLLNLLVFGMDLQDAVDAPRFRHLNGLRVALEEPIPDHVRAALAALGHDVVDESNVAFGGAQAILRLERGYAAASDPRKDGMAAGH